MCFSAPASFAAGAALLPAGVYCAWQAWRKDRRLLPLGLVPALLGAQQIAEGFVWQALGRDSSATVPALAFLFFALILWPVWVPLCATFIELPPGPRALVRLFALASLAWAFVYAPLFLDPDLYLRIQVTHHSIRYDYFELPVYAVVSVPLLRILYFGTIAVPMVLAGIGNGPMRHLGILFGVSAVVSQFYFSYAFASVWCFFAAILSGYLCLVFRSLPAATT
jgi:hypothetical protein